MMGRSTKLGLRGNYGGWVAGADKGTCDVSIGAAKVSYTRVFKSGNQYICTVLRHVGHLMHNGTAKLNLNTTQDKSQMRKISFSVVRDPFDHFLSGFSEIAKRARHSKDKIKYYKSSHYTFLPPNDGDADPAAFIHDLLRLQLHRVQVNTDQHAFTQVAFLAHAHLHLLGDLKDLGMVWEEIIDRVIQINQETGALPNTEEDAAALRALLDLSNTPYAASEQHASTNAFSNNTARAAMKDLIFPPPQSSSPSAVGADRNSTSSASHDSQPSAYRLAMCHILLPDYACFGMRLPDDCAREVGDPNHIGSHGVSCPIKFPERIHSARRS